MQNAVEDHMLNAVKMKILVRERVKNVVGKKKKEKMPVKYFLLFLTMFSKHFFFHDNYNLGSCG